MKPVFRTRLLNLWRTEICPLLILAVVLFSLRSSLADWNDVPTGSMVPTILVGDRIWVNKLAYDLKVPFTTWRVAEWGDPARGEIAVFYSPHDGTRLVKRIIGLPGDTLELRQNRLWINGEPVAYGAVTEVPGGSENPGKVLVMEDLPGQRHPVAATPGIRAARDFGPYNVPEGHYFAMGDNRDESFDSRFFGSVPRQAFLGRAAGVVFSLDREHWWRPRLERVVRGLDRD